MTALAALDPIPAVLRAGSDCLYRGGQRTLAGTAMDGRDAPIPAVRLTMINRLKLTLNRPSFVAGEDFNWP